MLVAVGVAAERALTGKPRLLKPGGHAVERQRARERDKGALTRVEGILNQQDAAARAHERAREAEASSTFESEEFKAAQANLLQ